MNRLKLVIRLSIKYRSSDFHYIRVNRILIVLLFNIMDEWFIENISEYYDENKGFDYFEMENTIQHLFQVFYIHKKAGILDEETTLYEHPEDLIKILQQLGKEYLMMIDISASFAKTIIQSRTSQIELSIQYIQSIPPQKQRSDEWFEFRKRNFTASDFYKIFSDKTLASMVKKKLNPSKIFIKPSGAMKKGIIFEDVAVQIYEKEHNCKVNEFGCIPHKTVPGLAASPDGIIIQKDCDKYGHMLEIKCVSTRLIDGIVPEQYWMQMQIQMEVCNLEFCDFLECLFLEKPSYDEWVNYVTETPSVKHYGILVEGMIGEDSHLIYGKLGETQYPSYPDNFRPTEVHYWYLNTLSTQTIRRNREWFQSVLPRVNHAVMILNQERDKLSRNSANNTNNVNNDSIEVNLNLPKRKKKREKQLSLTDKNAPCMIDSD